MATISKKWTAIILILIAVSYAIFFAFEKLTSGNMILIAAAILFMVFVRSFHPACPYGIIYKGDRRKDDTILEGIILSSWGVDAMATVCVIVWMAYKFNWI